MTLLQDAAAILSGSAVGFILCLVGGGGSILAVPLLVYGVGMSSPHVAIGTSAVAVSLSALGGLIGHLRAGTIAWPCAIPFTLSGVAGAMIGSSAGKSFNGAWLLILFGALMIVIAGMMLRRQHGGGVPAQPRPVSGWLIPRLMAYGLGTGALSGFFGIGGGFLIVPGLIAAAGLPMLLAVGSSLVSVAAFSTTTAVAYAYEGLVEWHVVALFFLGSLAGSLMGARAAVRLAGKEGRLARVFAGVVASAGVYVIARGVFG